LTACIPDSARPGEARLVVWNLADDLIAHTRILEAEFQGISASTYGAPPLVICAERLRVLAFAEHALATGPATFKSASYSLSSLEVFDPFMERVAPLYTAIPYLDDFY
jgi:hypothetical protein